MRLGSALHISQTTISREIFATLHEPSRHHRIQRHCSEELSTNMTDKIDAAADDDQHRLQITL